MDTLYNTILPRNLLAIHANWELVPDELKTVDDKVQIDKLMKNIHKKTNGSFIEKLSKPIRNVLCAEYYSFNNTKAQQKHIKTYLEVSPGSNRINNYKYIKDSGEVIGQEISEQTVKGVQSYLDLKKVGEPKIEVSLVEQLIDITGFDYDENLLRKPDEEDQELSYDDIKVEFEKSWCQIQSPLCYVNISPYGRNIYKFREVCEINSHLKCGKESFCKKWLDDQEKRSFAKIDFLPPPLVCPDDVYNLWEGFKIPEETGGTIQPFLDLIHLIGGSEVNDEYIIQWIAKIFQKPGTLARTALIIRGEPGTGKNTVYETLNKLLVSYSFITSDPANDVFGRFSTMKQNKLLMCLDETDSKQTFPNNEKIKALITTPTMNIEQKGINAFQVNSYLALMFLTNNTVPVKIEQGDRRFTVFDISSAHKGDSEYWDNYNKWVEEPKNVRAVYDYLMDKELTLNLEIDRPITEAYREIQESCLPLEVKWLTNLIIEEFPMGWGVNQISGRDVFESFRQSVPEKFEVSEQRLGRWITKNAIHGITRSHTVSGVKYTFDRKLVFNWLRSKNYTRITELPVALIN